MRFHSPERTRDSFPHPAKLRSCESIQFTDGSCGVALQVAQEGPTASPYPATMTVCNSNLLIDGSCGVSYQTAQEGPAKGGMHYFQNQILGVRSYAMARRFELSHPNS